MRAKHLVGLACGLMIAFATGTASAQLPFFGHDSNDKPTLAPLLKEVTPAVVSIVVEGHREVMSGSSFNDPLLERFFGMPSQPSQPQIVPQQGAGSGVIIDAENGYVLTNHHVIANADRVLVNLKDKRQFEAEIIGSDEGTDIGLLKIDADGLKALRLGDSDSLEVGDFVLAIGNPFGLGQTVTSGIVSALGRGGLNAEGYEDFIQTDASINPGNSGGALVDLDGQLVGINSAIIAPSGGNVGIGFAVPSNMARSVVDQLLEYGEVRRGMLGVQISDLAPDLAEGLGLDIENGAVVQLVSENSPAERAGLQPGDVIIEYAGHDVDGSADLRNQVGLTRAGETVELVYVREGHPETTMVTIGEGSSFAAEGGGATIEKLNGAEFRNLQPGDPQYGRTMGVLVSRVTDGSPAAQQGLQPGDVITAINNRYPVRSLEELETILRQAQGTFGLNVQRNGRRVFLVIR